MQDDKKGWKQFKAIKLDRKKLAKRVKRAEGATVRHAHRFIIKRFDNIRLVSREVTIWLLLVAVLIAGMGVQLMWSQQGYMTTGRAPGGVYVEGSVGAINSLNPLYVSTSSEASLARLVFSSLYNYDAKGGLRQDIATGMTVDASKRVYTISLRNNAKWHDGKPLTSQDVVYTINLIKSPASRSPLRINWLDVSVTAPNATTVQFNLPAVYAAFPYALTFPILPYHLLKDISPAAVRESAYSQAPVGSGPFTLRRLQSADNLMNHKVAHLTANEEYYAGAPLLSRFELHAYNDEDSLLKAISIGEVTGAADISASSVSRIKNPQYKVTPLAVDSGVYVMFNTMHPLLKEATIRKALQLGTNTSEIRTQMGDVPALDLPVLHDQIKGDDIPRAPTVDVAGATKLLDDAGWKLEGGVRVKEGQKLEFTITTTRNQDYRRVIDMLEAQWRKLGVLVKKNIVDTTTAGSNFVQGTLQSRNFDMLLYELSIGADPDVYAYWHSSQMGQFGYNFSNYNNKVADASLASARERLEPELRSAKYRQFAKQWLEDAPAIGLYQSVTEYVSNKNANAVEPRTRLVTPSDRYADVLYWSVSPESVYKSP